MPAVLPIPYPDASAAPGRRSNLEHDHSRLRRSLETLVHANRCVTALGPNADIEVLGDDLGLEDTDYVSLDIRLAHRRVSIVCVPSRVWNRARSMSVMLELKAAATALGHAVLLVPETFVRRQPRLTNSEMISAAGSIDVNATDRMSILQFLMENGDRGSLSDVAALVRHPDPVAAILHLVTVGSLHLDLDAPILPSSEIRLAGPR